MSLLKDAFDRRGLKCKDLCNKPGLNYTCAYRHYNGMAEISPEYAIKYEDIFGIPRSELRPDLWPPEKWDIVTDFLGWNNKQKRIINGAV